jgi:hypothetical protein
MRAILIAGLVAIAPVAAFSQDPKPYTTADTSIGTLLDDPAAKEVLAKHLPQLVNGGQADQARPLTLKAIQQYAPDAFPDKVLAAIDADLAKLPPRK